MLIIFYNNYIMARTRKAGRRIKRGGMPEWYADATKKLHSGLEQATSVAKDHAEKTHKAAKKAHADASVQAAAAAKEAHAAAAVHADKLKKHAAVATNEAHAATGKHLAAAKAAAVPHLGRAKVAASGLGTNARGHMAAAKVAAAPHLAKAKVTASGIGPQAKAHLAAAHAAAKLSPTTLRSPMKGGLRRRKTTLKYKHPKKGMKSRTRKGRKDFTTKKTSKVFNRRKHYQRKSAKGVKRRPFRKCKCIC
jgi:hypothetical protein